MLGRTLCLGEEKAICLYDTTFNKTLELLLPEPLAYVESKFHFSRNETRLTCFLFDKSWGLAVVIWDCLRPSPRLTNIGSLGLDWTIGPAGILVHKVATSAVIVTGTRSIQRVEFGDEIKFLDAEGCINEYPHSVSTISRDGSHLALVIYSRKGGKVQITDLTSPDAPDRHFMVQWSQSDIPETLTQGYYLPIGISSDLCVLIVNAEVFDLTTNTTNDKYPREKPNLTPSVMEAAPALLRPHRHRIEPWYLRCLISPCNSYVIYVCQGDQWGK